MPDTFWTPDRQPAQETAAYSLVMCLLANATLYVVVTKAGPLDAEQPPVRIHASVANLAELQWHGQSATAQKRGQLLIGRFERPPPDCLNIYVRMTADGQVVFAEHAQLRTRA